MRPPSAVASAPAGGSREQEQGEAQGEAQGGSEVRGSGRVRVIRRVASGEREDEESLASSPFAIRHSLFTIHCGHSSLICGARRPADGLARRRASHMKRDFASFRLPLANVSETPTLLEDSPPKASASAFGPSRAPSGDSAIDSP